MSNEDEEQTDLDILMSRDPLELTDQDLNAIIKYQRKQRANFESGVKPKKQTAARVKIDISALIPEQPKFTRR